MSKIGFRMGQTKFNGVPRDVGESFLGPNGGVQWIQLCQFEPPPEALHHSFLWYKLHEMHLRDTMFCKANTPSAQARPKHFDQLLAPRNMHPSKVTHQTFSLHMNLCRHFIKGQTKKSMLRWAHTVSVLNQINLDIRDQFFHEVPFFLISKKK